MYMHAINCNDLVQHCPYMATSFTKSKYAQILSIKNNKINSKNTYSASQSQLEHIMDKSLAMAAQGLSSDFRIDCE